MTFTAIDFETAHPKRWSICQVGLGKNYELLIINYELKARIAIHNSAFIIYNYSPFIAFPKKGMSYKDEKLKTNPHIPQN